MTLHKEMLTIPTYGYTYIVQSLRDSVPQVNKCLRLKTRKGATKPEFSCVFLTPEHTVVTTHYTQIHCLLPSISGLLHVLCLSHVNARAPCTPPSESTAI